MKLRFLYSNLMFLGSRWEEKRLNILVGPIPQFNMLSIFSYFNFDLLPFFQSNWTNPYFYFVKFLNKMFPYGEKLVPRPTMNLEDCLLSAVRYCLFIS